MGRWVGNYKSDSSQSFARVLLEVFRVDLDTRSSFLGGERSTTDKAFDLIYLPPTFVSSSLNSEVCCVVPYDQLRHLRLYFTETGYLFVPLPFPGVSTNFAQTILEIGQNPNIVRWILRGEVAQNAYLRRAVG